MTRKTIAKVIAGRFTWHGPDRRRVGDRREGDRRHEVRYEPAKEDRRLILERREDARTADSYRQAKHPDRNEDD